MTEGLIEERRSSPLRAALLGGLMVGTAVCALTILVLLSQRNLWTSSSTAPIGQLFVPFFGAMLAVPGAAFGGAFGYALSGWKSGRRFREPRMAVAALVMLAVTGWAVWELGRAWLLGGRVQRVETLSEPELGQVLESGWFGRNPYVLAAIALNPKTSEETLDRITRISDPGLYEPLGSFFDDVAGKNRHGLSVMRLVATNPATRAESLERLAASSEVYLLSDLARSPKLADATIERLAGRSEPSILRGVAFNPRTPPEVLDRLSRSEDRHIRLNVAVNRGTPPEILRRLWSDPDALVRREAFRAATAPPDAVPMAPR
jgi:hypothetical protein